MYISAESGLEVAAWKPLATACEMDGLAIESTWGNEFPSGEQVVDMVLSMTSGIKNLTPDKRLLQRRECEFSLFRSIEKHFLLPEIQKGFLTMEDFVSFASSTLNRRKSRSGNSLELQTKGIFLEQGLCSFSHNEISENNSRPDFLFPSVNAYGDESYPAGKLRMLAVKTTCKDRWRQVLQEADRITNKHLLTLQEGVSTNQIEQMESAGLTLVVPEPLQERYDPSVRSRLQGLDQFIKETSALYE